MLTLATVPADVADSMITEGRAEVAQGRRGAAGVAQIAIEVLAATANTVTILVATKEIRELIGRTREKNEGKTIVIQIKSSDSNDFEISADAPKSEDEEIARLAEEALERARRQRKIY